MVKVEINLLVLLLLVEFLVLFIIATVALKYKLNKGNSPVSSKRGGNGSFAKNIEALINNELQTLKAALLALESADEKSTVDKEVLEVKMSFTQKASDLLQTSGEELELYFRQLLNTLEDILHEYFTNIFEGNAVQGSDGLQTVAIGRQQPTDMGKEQIIRLLRYSEFFDELIKEFTKIKNDNEKMLGVIEENAVNSEELMQLAMDFNNNNEKIAEYISVLKREHGSLNEKIDAFQKTQRKAAV
ncbi:MAG: hypothetical protein L3V56_12130 [Candidatus Magnetoovum sp. WYHC-5]|nr:hypothetical protein [Candidatus Magnetoovum sp. WYHC-5]